MTKEEYNLKQKQYYQKNKEILALKKKERYLKNRELILEKVKKYRIDNLEKIKEYDRIRGRKRLKKGYSQSSTYNLTNAERNKNKWMLEVLTIYHLKIIDDDGTIFYKYGLTKNLKQRLEKIPYKIKTISSVTINKYEAVYLEYNLLKNVKRYKPLKKFQGYTECFITN